jgi:hypothetical protein
MDVVMIRTSNYINPHRIMRRFTAFGFSVYEMVNNFSTRGYIGLA